MPSSAWGYGLFPQRMKSRERILWTAVLVFILILVTTGCQDVKPPLDENPSHSLFIRKITVIDGNGNPPLEEVDLEIQEGVIRRIGRDLSPPPQGQVIEGLGKFLIPGLIDVHVHLDAPMVFQLSAEEREEILKHNPKAFLYNGVTTVLNLSSDPEWIWQLRQKQRQGLVAAPRIFATGSSFTPEGGWGSRHGGAIADAEAARRTAQALLEQGADGFKIILEDGLGGSGTYREMPDDILQAIVEVAQQNSIPLYIHAMNVEEFRRAATVSPRAIVHGLEDPLPEDGQLLTELLEAGTIIVPTQSLFESFRRMDGSFSDQVLQKSVPSFLLDRMQDPEFQAVEKSRFREVARIDVEEWVEEALPVFCRNIRTLHEAGVPLAVGTDAGGPVGYNFQGYNTPWEVKLLVDCGLTPREALVAATRNGARTIGVADRIGTVEEGKTADLLILSGNPLREIENIRRIETIVMEGKVFPREDFSY